MKRSSVAIIFCLCVFAACSAMSSGGSTGWKQVSATLGAKLDPASKNVCTRGAAECVDIVLAEMNKRLDRLITSCDHRAPFALAYAHTTRAIRDATRSADPGTAAYLRHLDAVFADLYFTVIDAWEGGRTDAVPEPWRLSFDTARRKQVTGLGDMLVGMNAHISRDLAVATSKVGLTLADGSSAKPAFDSVNDVFNSVQGPMMAEAAARLDPTIAQVHPNMLGPGASTVGQLLGIWREESWTNAERLAAASDAQRPAVLASIDANASTRGAGLVVANSYVPFITSTTSRDDFCKSHQK